MNLTGKIVALDDVISGESHDGKPWCKQIIVVEYNPEYHKCAAVEMFGEDKVKMLQSLKVGDRVCVDFSIDSRQFNDKWFVQLKGYSVAAYTPQ